jgi:hypothetical protein
MIVSFDPSYTGGGTDKWWSFYADAPEIYSVKSGNNYSINRYNTLIDNLTVDISTKIGVAGTFSISAPGISQFTLCGKVMLEDLKTGTITNLKTTPSYEFAGSPDDSKERFRLLLGSPIGINEPVTNTLNIYSSYKTIYIQHETADEPYLVSISNMIGQVLDTRKLTGNSVNRIDLNLVPGVYIVTVVSEGKTLSKKVVIR